MLIRHALGVIGVLSAGVLLAVSCAMNWRFGFSLGRTEFDGQIYGAASAAADCLKALVPFFFFAAVRNKMWSQAIASVLVWGVVSAYSLTSALGHAALNRFDSSGHRAVEAQSYKDLRADMERAKEQLGWIPQHRPIATVQSEIEGLKTKREWIWSSSCTEIKGKQTRDFCQQLHTLSSELASAQQAAALEARIAEVEAKLAKAGGGTVMAEADPQAKVLADLSGRGIGEIQTALVIFVALLLEIGSGLGMYVAFSQWRWYDRQVPYAPAMTGLATASMPAMPVAAAPIRTRAIANDNRLAAGPVSRVAPESDVQLFYKERIETEDGSSVTATTLYEDYCEWCEENKKEPLALPSFGREFSELGVQKSKQSGRIRYHGIALKSGKEAEEDKKLPALPARRPEKGHSRERRLERNLAAGRPPSAASFAFGLLLLPLSRGGREQRFSCRLLWPRKASNLDR